ncbi:SDR family oxidoreductase [Aestuariibacter sp. A3R04]|uniref:SDR family oxidoreductase n=1 Tax=Aestuariibacter sp. A3R04 TaxID=2841571 RepID=UPI001C095A03|nr:SDR family oxidoreductase [Aestuariibacter sp. A3R04]MBU3022023.1 SDR family oxidoreductase [Aestuariibacter sp. A3R04]
MKIDWSNQIALLTGASGGIGSAMAKALDEQGAQLILVGRCKEKLVQLRDTLDGHHFIVEADIITPQGREKVVHTCQRHPVTMLINNAGITHLGEFTLAPVDDVVATNLLAPMLLTQQLLPILKMRQYAHVINIGSTFGSIGFAAHGAYCATKFGLKGWTEAMIREYHDSDIHFHYLAPRATCTAINDRRAVALNLAMGNKVDSPEDVARSLILLLNKNKSRVAMGLPEKVFAIVNALLPSLVDSSLAKKLALIKAYTFEQTTSIEQQQDNPPLADKQV